MNLVMSRNKTMVEMRVLYMTYFIRGIFAEHSHITRTMNVRRQCKINAYSRRMFYDILTMILKPAAILD